MAASRLNVTVYIMLVVKEKRNFLRSYLVLEQMKIGPFILIQNIFIKYKGGQNYCKF